MVLGGSWVVRSGVISPRIWVLSIVTLLITPTYVRQSGVFVCVEWSSSQTNGLRLSKPLHPREPSLRVHSDLLLICFAYSQ